MNGGGGGRLIGRWGVAAAVALGAAGAVGAAGAAGCSDALEQASSAGQVIGFSDSSALSLIAAAGFSVTTLHLGAGYTRAALAGRGSVILVGRSGNSRDTSRVDVLDLARSATTLDQFPIAGTAIGATIEDDSLAWVAVSTRGAVARVNYRTHVATAVSVGGTPRAVAFTAGHVFVITSTGSGSWVSEVDPARAVLLDSIPLSGAGASAAVVGGDSLLYVIEAGPTSGKVSVVDPVGRQELVVINGLSSGIGSPVFHPAGRLLIAAGTDGILEVNTLTRSVTRGPGHGVRPGGHGVLALALDNGGRVYAGDSSCAVVHVLAAPPDYNEIRAVDVLGCPAAAGTAVRP